MRFIGEKPEEDSISQLQMITQVIVKDGKAICHSVEEHLDEFESLLNLVQGEDNFSINVAVTVAGGQGLQLFMPNDKRCFISIWILSSCIH
jgi:hypothetical protein